MPRLAKKTPSYRLHRATGQALVVLDGRVFYLGRHGTPASRAEYDRLVAEWLNAGRRLPGVTAEGRTVVELIDLYWRHVTTYHVKPDGSPAYEQVNIREALRPVKELYGHVAVGEFGPIALKTIRDSLAAASLAPKADRSARSWCRSNINRHLGRVKAMFAWAVSEQLIAETIYRALLTVPGIRKGKGAARENPPVRPVADSVVEATIPFAPPPVAAMIRLQRLTGMRPGEVTGMRGREIDTSADVWLYTPAHHKTAHHDKARIIPLGDHAQTVLRSWLKDDQDTPLEAEMTRRAARRKNIAGAIRTVDQGRLRVGENYAVAAYRRAIARACDRAFPAPPPLARLEKESAKAWAARLTVEERQALAQWQSKHRWHPHQIRHSVATELRRKYGLDKARAMLGHSSVTQTEDYAEMDLASAVEIARQVG